MIVVSLVLNIVVLVPVTVSILRAAGWVESAFGARTPARDILLSVYIAILAVSCALLAAMLSLPDSLWVVAAAGALLIVQVVYKLLTPISVRRGVRNPVVASNLAIAAVHVLTLAATLPTILAGR
ncbi:hypothetical protein BH11ACT3_BH11ACT3_05910 [soil metagenome]